MLLSREQFIDHWNNKKQGLGNTGSPLWHPEKGHENLFRYFIDVRPIRIFDQPDKNDFWIWCDKHCQGLVRCFSSNYTEEWWGFTNRDDLALWILKWT